jgi:hypothetical protein
MSAMEIDVRKHTEGELLASLRLRIDGAKKRHRAGGSNTVSMSFTQAERLLEMAKMPPEAVSMTKEMDVRDVVKLAREAKLPKYMFDTNDGRLALMRFAERLAKMKCKKCDQLERELADALLDAALHRNAAEQLGDMARDASPKCKKCDYPNCFCERKGK